jgi:hypothetical protein
MAELPVYRSAPQSGKTKIKHREHRERLEEARRILYVRRILRELWASALIFAVEYGTEPGDACLP